MASRRKILVVDDNSDMLQLNRVVLEMEGYEIRTADDRPSALYFLETEQFDLILLDFKLRDITGPELLEEVHSSMPKVLDTTPVVYLTGSDDIDCRFASGIIPKATDLQCFVAEVRLHLGGDKAKCAERASSAERRAL
jgi:CheY-like chemotaxis protein